jgi:glycosyltransferase involved in cell wall biosynthesis
LVFVLVLAGVTAILSGRMHACTIAARNYLAHARVLMNSFLRHHPNARTTLLLVDGRPEDGLTVGDRFETLFPQDIGLDPVDLRNMFMIYEVTEMSTALKPALLKHLVDQASEPVVYLDPDCFVYDRLDEVDELASLHSLVLTPHVRRPIPRDGLLVDEQQILWSGIFNLGFVAVTSAAGPFLEWWGERTRFDALRDPPAAHFTDQRWVDFVPALFPHYVLRDPGYNVAYWNLFERPVARRTDGTLTAGGAPLRFFHFSGYDPDDPHVLSTYQGDRPRARLSDHPVVAELCAEYRVALRRADFDGAKYLPYRFETIAGGPIDVIVRRLIREVLLDPQETGKAPPYPFGDDDGRAFVEWLNEPVIRFSGGSVSRLVRGAWRARVDIQFAFPDGLGADAPRFARWAAYDPSFQGLFGHLDRSSNQPRRAPRQSEPAPGLNVVGYFDAELGVGEAGRVMVRAAERAGLPVATHVCRSTLSRQGAGFERPGSSAPAYDFSLFCVNADSISQVVAEFEGVLSRDLYRIGLWFWELEEFPDYGQTTLDCVDEIWVASPFTRDAIARNVKKQIHVFPLPIVPDPPTCLTRGDLGIPEGFLFVFCFDALSVLGRKNPGAVIDAFQRAFPTEGEALLVLKSINGERRGADFERLRGMAGGRRDIQIVDEYWAYQHVGALVQLCDCYVSLHRSEGFGLTLAAAMAQGRPVIGTGYSGNLAFMNDTNSLLVPYDLVNVGPGNHPYPPEGRWAEPDVCAAADLMLRVRADPAWAADVGARGRESVANTHGLDRSASALLDHFDRLVGETMDARLTP